MEFPELLKPTKHEQKIAQDSYAALMAAMNVLHSDNLEIEIEETKQRIKIPIEVLKLLASILKATGQGRPVSIFPVATELSTQSASELLGCSRPYLIRLLDAGEIEHTKVGRHRRVKYEDIVLYKRKMKAKQKEHLVELMNGDEDLGLYDS